MLKNPIYLKKKNIIKFFNNHSEYKNDSLFFFFISRNVHQCILTNLSRQCKPSDKNKHYPYHIATDS